MAKSKDIDRKSYLIYKICECLSELLGDAQDDILVDMCDKIYTKNKNFNANVNNMSHTRLKKLLLSTKPRKKSKVAFTPILKSSHAKAFRECIALCDDSITKLAKRAGVSLHYISNICNGKTAEILPKYAYLISKCIDFKIKPWELSDNISPQMLIPDEKMPIESVFDD